MMMSHYNENSLKIIEIVIKVKLLSYWGVIDTI